MSVGNSIDLVSSIISQSHVSYANKRSCILKRQTDRQIDNKGRLQNPQSRKVSVRGVPPPPGALRTRFFCKVSEKFLTDKGGTPPPLKGRKIQKFFAASGIFWCFSPKKHCF